MDRKTNPFLFLVGIAIVAAVAWFVLDGYVNADPAAQGVNPASQQQLRLN